MKEEGEIELENLRRATDILAENYGWTQNQVLELSTKARKWYVQTVQTRNKEHAEKLRTIRRK